MQIGELITVDIEKAVAGGRMLARHNGQIAFVAGAIPGERVRARVSRVSKGTLYAEIDEVLVPSSDRRKTDGDGRCGGNVLNHITPERQTCLKGEIVEDAFKRIARLPLASTPPVVASPEHGYRMRARLHVVGGTLGFLKEGSHDVCDVESTGQLLPETTAWIRRAALVLGAAGLPAVQSIEIAENLAASERACHLELAPHADAHLYRDLAAGLVGLSAQAGVDFVQLSGHPFVTDQISVKRNGASGSVTLARDVRAFFQGNRYLIEQLVNHVASLVPAGPVVDLYAGVGLFGLSLAALGHEEVTLVEGDRFSGANLASNAMPFGARAQVRWTSVERFLEGDKARRRDETVVADPPRTGFSPPALRGLLGRAPARIVYVSCDPPTLARDARAIVDAGYRLEDLHGFDLFPNTAHVESVAHFDRR